MIDGEGANLEIRIVGILQEELAVLDIADCLGLGGVEPVCTKTSQRAMIPLASVCTIGQKRAAKVQSASSRTLYQHPRPGTMSCPRALFSLDSDLVQFGPPGQVAQHSLG